MKKSIRNTETECLESVLQEYKAETDPKLKVGHLKIAVVLSKLIREDEQQVAEDANKRERLKLDKEKQSFEEQKHSDQLAQESAKIALSKRELDIKEREIALRERELDIEILKLNNSKKAAIVDSITRVVPAIIGFGGSLLYFSGMLMSMKLEYNDMGRTPSATKDFLRKI